MASPAFAVPAGLAVVTFLWWRLVFIGWVASESSGGHRAVLFDQGQSHPGINVNSEGCPHGIEHRSDFGRSSERCRLVVILRKKANHSLP